MWRSLVIVVLIAGAHLAAASAIQPVRMAREKKGGFVPGLATIVGTLTLLKIKAIFVSLVVFAIAAVLTKVLGAGVSTGCTGLGSDLGLGCGTAALLGPTAHSNLGSPPFQGSTYDQSNTYQPYYNHRRSIDGFDIVDMSLEVLGLETDDCKKKFVCLADNEAQENPLLHLVMQAFGSSLSKYRDGDEEGSGDGDSSKEGDSDELKDCDKLYPKCDRSLSREDKPTNKLPPKLKDVDR